MHVRPVALFRIWWPGRPVQPSPVGYDGQRNGRGGRAILLCAVYQGGDTSLLGPQRCQSASPCLYREGSGTPFIPFSTGIENLIQALVSSPMRVWITAGFIS